MDNRHSLMLLWSKVNYYLSAAGWSAAEGLQWRLRDIADAALSEKPLIIKGEGGKGWQIGTFLLVAWNGTIINKS